MALYLVESKVADGKTHKKGVKNMIVRAASAANAKLLADAYHDGDSTWSDSTATAFTEAHTLDLEGFVYRIRISAATPGDPDLVDVSVTGDTSDGIDEVGADLVVALNATSAIDNASYASPTLTIAAIADGIGDHTVSFEVTPASAERPYSPMVGTIVDEGIAAAALTAVLLAPSATPAIIAAL